MRLAPRRTSEMPQRRLALRLRSAIDICMSLSYDTPTSIRNIALARVRRLLAENPHNAASRHVEHNLGRKRLDWLRQNQIVLTSSRPAHG